MNKPVVLLKTLFMEGIRCPRLLWLRMNRPEFAEPFNAGTLHLFEVGHRVEVLARQLFDEGTLVERNLDRNSFQLIEQTECLIKQKVPILYEATFSDSKSLCRADILVKTGTNGKSRWNLNEVKMSTQVKDEHYLDTAFQCRCIEGREHKIDTINLVHINTDYTRIGDLNIRSLFSTEDITSIARQVSGECGKQVDKLSQMTSEPSAPEVIMGSRCKNPGRCPFFKYCHDSLPQGSIYEIPYGSHIIPQLINRDIKRIVDIPADIKLSDRQRSLVKSFRSGRPVIDIPAVNRFLKTIRYPVYYLDFETVSPCIPAVDNSSPYEKLPFQYSLHVRKKPEGELNHFEYLHDSATDPRRSLMQDLLRRIGKGGTIIAWNKSFEESVLKLITSRFPEFTDAVRSMLERFTDLIVPFRSGLYVDYRFKGSSSIKSVLPVLVPELSYKHMSIKRGDEASLLFELFLEGTMPAPEWQSYRTDLLRYCCLDTLAMVRIHEELLKLI